jgi:hypothetical protein
VPSRDRLRGIMPAPHSGLRGLYLGDIERDLILKTLIRFSLYTDQLFVVNPVHNPWVLRAEYNPIDNPDQFKADTIRVLYFLFQIAPWIESGIVQLILDPSVRAPAKRSAIRSVRMSS